MTLHANTDDGSCDFTSCVIPGCTLMFACNYDPLATVYDGSCEFPDYITTVMEIV